MLWAWYGQLSQLPPPAVSVMALITVSGLDIPVPGERRRVIRSPENTAHKMKSIKPGICVGGRVLLMHAGVVPVSFDDSG